MESASFLFLWSCIYSRLGWHTLSIELAESMYPPSSQISGQLVRPSAFNKATSLSNKTWILSYDWVTFITGSTCIRSPPPPWNLPITITITCGSHLSYFPVQIPYMIRWQSTHNPIYTHRTKEANYYRITWLSMIRRKLTVTFLSLTQKFTQKHLVYPQTILAAL